MRITEASPAAVTILFTGEPVPAWRALTSLVRRTLRERGLAPWSAAETECFRAGEDTLVIARPGELRRRAFFFPDLETLLGGVSGCPAGQSSLYALEEGYLLAAEGGMVCPSLYEFGEERPLRPDWETHAAEQGGLLLEGDAAADLRRWFSP